MKNMESKMKSLEEIRKKQIGNDSDFSALYTGHDEGFLVIDSLSDLCRRCV